MEDVWITSMWQLNPEHQPVDISMKLAHIRHIINSAKHVWELTQKEILCDPAMKSPGISNDIGYETAWHPQ